MGASSSATNRCVNSVSYFPPLFTRTNKRTGCLSQRRRGRRKILTSLGVHGVLIRVGRITANHLARLATGDPDLAAPDRLDVVQAAQNLVLHLELGLHGELGTLLDGEGLLLEVLQRPGRRQVDHDGLPAGRLHGERVDDAHARVVGVGQVVAAAEAEGLLVALEGLVVLV